MIIKMLKERRDDPEGVLCSLEYDKVIAHIEAQDRLLKNTRRILAASQSLLITHGILPEGNHE